MAEDIDDERRAEKKREALERRKAMERERRKAIRAAYARQREAKKKKVGVLSAVRNFDILELAGPVNHKGLYQG